MRRAAGLVLFALVLSLLAGLWFRNSWTLPRREYAFDFSINYTGSRLIHITGEDRALYDRAVLRAEADPYTPFWWLYQKQFLTYIQTPITAVATLPFSWFEFNRARDLFLGFSNLLLVAAAAITVWALRPSRLLVLAAFAIFATFLPMFESLRLGQVDGLIVFSLAVAFAFLTRGPPWLAGAPLALAAILKLSPVLVIGYFAVRRCWRLVAVAAGSLVGLMALSVLIAGWDNNLTFVRDVMPGLMKGSPWLYNISIPGAVLRLRLGEGYFTWDDQPPDVGLTVRALMLALNAALVAAAYWSTRKDSEAGFMLAIAAGMLISPVAWSFYPVWLVPSMLWLVRRYEDRRDWGLLAAGVLLYPLLVVEHDDLTNWFGIGVHLYPFKTLVYVAYAGLLAWEGIRGGRRTEATAALRRAPAATAAR